jgi:hypothetical protein
LGKQKEEIAEKFQVANAGGIAPGRAGETHVGRK